jgi:general secretion pathway protein B
MSYILDALQKAESERKLGALPNLYAQQVPIYPWDARVPFWRRPSLWMVLAALGAILAALAWRQPWQTIAGSSAADTSVAQALPKSAPIIMKPAPPRTPVERPPVVAAVTVPAPLPKPPRAEPARQRVEPARTEKPREKKSPKLAEPSGPPAVKESMANDAPPGPAPMPVAERPVPTLRELPVNIQREIPAVAIGGYIYASSPAERSMLINKKLLREGDQVAPGLMLETMMAKEAVLNYRGYRYRIAYQ